MITLNKLAKEYDLVGSKVQALKEVSLTIERGEYVAVMGPSGSGKSTLMHLLGILDTASSGQYLLEDYDITSLPDREQARIRNKHFGFIFQSFHLFSELSALENVMLPMGYANVPFKQKKDRASALLEEVGLKDRLHHLPTMMSGGEQQRVAIARALSNDPDVILADEPTGNLPSDKGEEIMQMLEGFNARGVTVVMVTHNPEQGRRARRRLFIKDGALWKDERNVKETLHA